ncbi:MAG: hypothetical protein AAGM67_20645, partial [Bacteroidota bacterium]
EIAEQQNDESELPRFVFCCQGNVLLTCFVLFTRDDEGFASHLRDEGEVPNYYWICGTPTWISTPEPDYLLLLPPSTTSSSWVIRGGKNSIENVDYFRSEESDENRNPHLLQARWSLLQSGNYIAVFPQMIMREANFLDWMEPSKIEAHKDIASCIHSLLNARDPKRSLRSAVANWLNKEHNVGNEEKKSGYLLLTTLFEINDCTDFQIEMVGVLLDALLHLLPSDRAS